MVDHSFLPCLNCPDSVAPIMVKSGSDIPCGYCMVRPGIAVVGLEMCQHFDAGWCYRRGIEVKAAVELFPRGQFRVDAGAAEEIERKLGLQ